jgi:hypothetical protein
MGKREAVSFAIITAAADIHRWFALKKQEKILLCRATRQLPLEPVRLVQWEIGAGRESIQLAS